MPDFAYLFLLVSLLIYKKIQMNKRFTPSLVRTYNKPNARHTEVWFQKILVLNSDLPLLYEQKIIPKIYFAKTTTKKGTKVHISF